MTDKARKPTFFESMIVILFMLLIILFGSLLFRIRIEMLMLAAAIFTGYMSKRLGYSWSDMEHAISSKIMQATPAILIVWVIGIVIASFMFSGSIPMVIYLGLKFVNPKYLYICSFFVCTVLSLATGTSWGSAATGGVAMIGIAQGMGIPVHITAAAVICGSLVGDKLSPLSETTNLAQ